MSAIASLFFSALIGSSAGEAHPQLAIEGCDFGETYAFNHGACDVTLSNLGDRSIHVLDIKADESADFAAPTQLVVDPHSKVYIHATVDTGNGNAYDRHIFHLRTDEQGFEDRSVRVHGFVMTVLDQSRPNFSFGVVDLTKEQPPKQIELGSHDVADFHLSKLIDKPSWVNVKLLPDGRTVSASVGADAPWGLRSGWIKFETNTQQQKEIWIEAKGDLHGDVVPSSNPVNLGMMHFGDNNEQLVKLTSPSGKPIALGKIELERIKGNITVDSCIPKADACRLLKLVVSDAQTPGSIVGDMIVNFQDRKQQLRIGIWGLIVPKNTEITKFEPVRSEMEKPGETGVTPKGTTADGKLGTLDQAIKNAVRQENELPPPGIGPLLIWNVANTEVVHGFQIFRADSEYGVFALMNKQSIPTDKNAGHSSNYQWRDNTAKSGKTYWYYIGIVYNDGHKQQLSGPQKVVAK